MGYFPFFMELSQLEGLIVGGGAVALRKIEKLLPYGARLTVAAPKLLPEIAEIAGLSLLRQPFSPPMLEGKHYVIAATDDTPLNRQISELCRERNIPVNVVDDRAACSFLFPALVKRGDLSIGISTGGASPSAAIYFKEQISALLPEDLGPMLTYLDDLRDNMKPLLPNGPGRARFFSRLFTDCLQAGWPIEDQRLNALLQDAVRDSEEET